MRSLVVPLTVTPIVTPCIRVVMSLRFFNDISGVMTMSPERYEVPDSSFNLSIEVRFIPSLFFITGVFRIVAPVRHGCQNFDSGAVADDRQREALALLSVNVGGLVQRRGHLQGAALEVAHRARAAAPIR